MIFRPRTTPRIKSTDPVFTGDERDFTGEGLPFTGELHRTPALFW
jgi:hypothetical protein